MKLKSMRKRFMILKIAVLSVLLTLIMTPLAAASTTDFSADPASRIAALEDRVTALENALKAEEAARIQGDVDTLNAAKLYIDQKIADEETARKAGDNNILAANKTESEARVAADKALSAALTSETASRNTRDNSLSSAISAEQADRKQGDSDTLAASKAYTDGKISEEATVRTTGFSQIWTQIQTDEHAATAVGERVSIVERAVEVVQGAIDGINDSMGGMAKAIEDIWNWIIGLGGSSGSTTN